MGAVGDFIGGAVNTVVDSASKIISNPGKANLGDLINVVAPAVPVTDAIAKNPEIIGSLIGTVAPIAGPVLGTIAGQLPSLPNLKLPDVKLPDVPGLNLGTDAFKGATDEIKKLIGDLKAMPTVAPPPVAGPTTILLPAQAPASPAYIQAPAAASASFPAWGWAVVAAAGVAAAAAALRGRD
ncbi:MAG: hypothetical protein HYZ75_00760 [Elusimicrobia bacterium]|nr:hypothetical protein [Elusimicrobiota bacterium]